MTVNFRDGKQQKDDYLQSLLTTDYRVVFLYSSMYFDEDGDLAHEFYEEVRPSKKGKKSFMKKVTRRLLPQGLVDLPHPRLHVDFPVVMCETCY